MGDSSDSVSYINNNDVTTPTGIVYRYMPFFIVMIAAAVAAIVVFILIKRRKTDDLD